MSTNLALLSYALLLPRDFVLRAIVLRAFVTARFCLRAFVGAVMSCALMSGHLLHISIYIYISELLIIILLECLKCLNHNMIGSDRIT